jgi:hypothetical protein
MDGLPRGDGGEIVAVAVTRKDFALAADGTEAGWPQRHPKEGVRFDPGRQSAVLMVTLTFLTAQADRHSIR